MVLRVEEMSEVSMNYVHSEVVMNNRLSEAHVDSWRERGFALVHDLLPAALLHELKDDALSLIHI